MSSNFIVATSANLCQTTRSWQRRRSRNWVAGHAASGVCTGGRRSEAAADLSVGLRPPLVQHGFCGLLCRPVDG